jgi:hypothetical protein
LKLALLALVLSSSCATIAPDFSADLSWLEHLAEGPPTPATLEPGIETGRADTAPLARGDRLLFELTFTRGQEETLRYLALEVGELAMEDGKPLTSSFKFTTSLGPGHEGQTRTEISTTRVHEIQLELFDATGELLRTSCVQLPEGVAQSQLAACESTLRLARDIAASKWLDVDAEGNLVDPAALTVDFEPYTTAIGAGAESLFSLFQLAQDDDLLSSLLWDVVEKPSLASLVLSLGVDVGIAPSYSGSQQLKSVPAGLDVPGPLTAFPMTIHVNEEIALMMELVVTESTPPLAMTGGIVAFQGRHPTKDIRVRARLVGTSPGASTIRRHARPRIEYHARRFRLP